MDAESVSHDGTLRHSNSNAPNQVEDDGGRHLTSDDHLAEKETPHFGAVYLSMLRTWSCECLERRQVAFPLAGASLVLLGEMSRDSDE